MYKVEKYRYQSDATNLFTNGKIYYLRSSKDGGKKYLTTDVEKVELKIGDKISIVSSGNEKKLRNNFVLVGSQLFNNYTDFRNHLEEEKKG